MRGVSTWVALRDPARISTVLQSPWPSARILLKITDKPDKPTEKVCGLSIGGFFSSGIARATLSNGMVLVRQLRHNLGPYFTRFSALYHPACAVVCSAWCPRSLDTFRNLMVGVIRCCVQIGASGGSFEGVPVRLRTWYRSGLTSGTPRGSLPHRKTGRAPGN